MLQMQGLLRQLFQQERAACGRHKLLLFSLPVLPLLAEAAVTFMVCRRYLSKGAVSVSNSIKSILLINVFLTLLLVCATLGEGVIMSCTTSLPGSSSRTLRAVWRQRVDWGLRQRVNLGLRQPSAATTAPLITSYNITSRPDEMQADSLQERLNISSPEISPDSFEADLLRLEEEEGVLDGNGTGDYVKAADWVALGLVWAVLRGL